MENNTASSSNQTPAPVTLGSLLKKVETPTAKVEFKEGIFFDLAYMPKARFREMLDSSTEQVYDPKTKSRNPTLNAKAFFRKFIAAAVRGWSGATPKSLSRIAPLDVSGLSDEQLNQPIEFSAEALLDLIEAAYELDSFIQNTAMDLNVFRPDHAEQVKN